MPSASDVEAILRDHGAVQEGHFVLASGNHSAHYVQTAQLMKEPHLVDDLLDDYIDEINETFPTVDKVLTAATGGITFAQQVGLKLRTTTIFAERSDSNELELNRGFQLSSMDNVLLVEDVVTTGGTLGELEALVSDSGATVVGALSMINRSGMTEWNNRPFLSLVSVNYPVYSPDECPRCDEDGEAVRPGTKRIDDESV